MNDESRMKPIPAWVHAIALVAVAMIFIAGVLANRVDRARAEAKSEIARVRASIPAESPIDRKSIIDIEHRLARADAALNVCKMRTEWLRTVVETFVPLADRVRIPDPPPGWKRWPTITPD